MAQFAHRSPPLFLQWFLRPKTPCYRVSHGPIHAQTNLKFLCILSRIEVPCRHRRKTMKPYSFTPHSPVALTGTAKKSQKKHQIIEIFLRRRRTLSNSTVPGSTWAEYRQTLWRSAETYTAAQCVNQGIVNFLFTYTLCSGSRDRSTFAQIFQRLVVSNLHDEITAKLCEVRFKLLTAPTRWLEFEK